MGVKVGYYPLLDTVLAIRQIFSIERFKPFCTSLESIDGKITLEERFHIHKTAKVTEDWLKVIARMIYALESGLSSTEELLIEAERDPSIIFGNEGTKEMVDLLAGIWFDYCFLEMTKVHKRINEKAREMAKYKNMREILEYLLSQTDRIERLKGDRIKFHIKPEMIVPLNDIENIIVMPSVFSSRNVSFWFHEKTFLFFVSLDNDIITAEEPSDMLLLRTLAFNDKTRLKMLRLLTESAKSVNDVAEALGINPSTASRHFKVFKDVGLVDIQNQEGNSIYYSLNHKEVQQALGSISHYILGRKNQDDQN